LSIWCVNTICKKQFIPWWIQKIFETNIEKCSKWYNQVFLLFIIVPIYLNYSIGQHWITFYDSQQSLDNDQYDTGPRTAICLTSREITHYKYWCMIKFWKRKKKQSS
jgi:hypothetical protein